MVNINSLERDGLRQAEFCPRNTMMKSIVPKIKIISGKENISVATWNVKTLRPAGKPEQLTHAMGMYHWNIVGPCKMR